MQDDFKPLRGGGDRDGFTMSLIKLKALESLTFMDPSLSYQCAHMFLQNLQKDDI